MDLNTSRALEVKQMLFRTTDSQSAVIRSVQCPKEVMPATYFAEIETLQELFLTVLHPEKQRLLPLGMTVFFVESVLAPTVLVMDIARSYESGGCVSLMLRERMERLETTSGTRTTSFGKWCRTSPLDSFILTWYLRWMEQVALFRRSHVQYKILGVYGKNSIDWVLAEQSCNAYNFSICPVYDTLGADSVEFILQQTGMKACVCGKEETLKVGVGGMIQSFLSFSRQLIKHLPSRLSFIWDLLTRNRSILQRSMQVMFIESLPGQSYPFLI